jgi:hypothetical protein
MTEKALALLLADAIWPWPGISILPDGQARKLSQAAAELRRLHAEIERLTAAWHCQHVRKVEERAEAKLWFEHAQKLHAVNAELLEALRQIAKIGNQPYGTDYEEIDEAREIARAAIAKAEGEK